ncbi:MAG: radical SAM protein [Acidobacteria bacterium]|nr:radical SAM protein [Acidobacteriota bacterium]
MSIEGLGVLLTFECNAECDHCYYHSAPRSKVGASVIEVAEFSAYMDSLKRTLAYLPGIAFLGGEPFLYYKHLLQMIGLVKGRSPYISILTNGYWGKNRERADRIVGELKEAGLNQLSFGADGFHDPFIPFQSVKNAILAARDGGLGVNVNVYLREALGAENEPDQISSAMVKELNAFGGISIGYGAVEYTARAAERLSPPTGAATEKELNDVCLQAYRGKFYPTDTFMNPRVISIDPTGSVTTCAGILIGNAKEKDLGEIIKDYRPEEHPIISVLIREGPMGLTRLPEAKGFQMKESYTDICQLCYDIRKHLRPHFPAELGPRQCYEEASRQKGCDNFVALDKAVKPE